MGAMPCAENMPGSSIDAAPVMSVGRRLPVKDPEFEPENPRVDAEDPLVDVDSGRDELGTTLTMTGGCFR